MNFCFLIELFLW
uniref:Uncharacterized protein n=1 Tax=Lepeophtheirus salmonis TaxID=72036 RepID=A0A0K2V208_LEPSM